ncbi:MAG: hydroxymethylbilane synthase [Verrucomicrobia bacterium]|nr:hydroxymethylbilane synthase [Verrucomicrobiota bacterium]
MSSASKPIYIASRGSALALAQANFVLGECRREFPERVFELKIIKTTGDKMQQISLSRIDVSLPRGLFTKELEDALLKNEADLAVHSLKDLPTILPEGLKLGASGKREDVRDVLIFREETFTGNVPSVSNLPKDAVVGTSSNRRGAQLLQVRPDLKIEAIRGNVGTRLRKLSENKTLAGIILAAAGLRRLGFYISSDGTLSGEEVPVGLKAVFLNTEEMLPCVGQAALGFEIRENDPLMDEICERLKDPATWACILAERAFLREMGGGCQTPVAALGEIKGGELQLKAVSFLTAEVRRSEGKGSLEAAETLGIAAAREIKA